MEESQEEESQARGKRAIVPPKALKLDFNTKRNSPRKRDTQHQQNSNTGTPSASGASLPLPAAEAHGGQHPVPPKGPPSSSTDASPRARPAPAPGDMVAARISPAHADKDDWILAKVLEHRPSTNSYDVIDEEPGEEEEQGPRKYSLDASYIIALPSASDPLSVLHDFPPATHVLAVFPGTTSLYRATVVDRLTTARQTKEDDYLLEFDDDEEEGIVGIPRRRVPFCHVVPLPTGHRQ